MSSRDEAFAKARKLNDSEKFDEAMEEISEWTSQDGIEYTLPEIETINAIISDKTTSCTFEDKKDACLSCIDLIEGAKLVKDARWLEMYNESVYDVFSKLSRCAREEEREQLWNRLKEIYYEITLAVKKTWKDKNSPGGLAIYLSFSKLVKSYLDVADEESFKMCDNFAKEAKFVGKGKLDDDEWKEANKAIETIKKNISDAKHEKELIIDD
ncbi:unnamed protein product [Caenorhabditis auriculariae]|uniref:DUF7758 domain-containing protein n=1 Tax=Caenorhabditis auriculariae TaxID=2777116 RepID=A0A8S1GRY8_9PELO|nr:unnamed protein product [Caenorhabditis auriculariae]